MTRNKRIMLATLPALALVVLGTSVASAHMRTPRELSEEQRSALEEARQLRKEGNTKEAHEVLRGVGLHQGVLHHARKDHAEGMMYGAEARERHEAMRAAIEAGDYDAFKSATVDAPFADMVTAENFEKLVAAHKLHEDGDHEAAFALMRELGFPGNGHRSGNQ